MEYAIFGRNNHIMLNTLMKTFEQWLNESIEGKKRKSPGGLTWVADDEGVWCLVIDGKIAYSIYPSHSHK